MLTKNGIVKPTGRTYREGRRRCYNTIKQNIAQKYWEKEDVDTYGFEGHIDWQAAAAV